MSADARTSPVVISVRGEASADVIPERVTVHVGVDIDGPDKAAVLHRAAEARERVIAAARAAHDADDRALVDWSASGLQVWSERPWSAEGVHVPLVFHSRSTLDAIFAGIDAVGAWTDQVSELDGISISGLDWSLTDSTRHELEEQCQRDAVAHAVAKTSVYASALGLNTVHLIDLAEPGVLSPQPPEPGPLRTMSLAAGTSGPTEFAPEPVRIAVEVHARFEASSAS
ncbi:uncharacterized protein YggE [Okibacterium sp. HSC-33S16]|uniref:SIMPL domain-containing protein n=1 Tax=Okibacterium sp. HSC-33S16 TaxID=2910965 RepID=UPI00209F31C2|nr:SIMPL domain-containing protein [Okibacterium sp. HSC-33S16]MCP2030477.1 uncharacterized protein YggE [Okibacterium sp. HSC-33S16]